LDKKLEGMHIVDLVDHIRARIMMTYDKKRIIGAKFQVVILPNVIKQLNVEKVSISCVTPQNN
jgi:hypothetical protein